MRTAIDTNILSALWSGERSARDLAELLGRLKTEGGLTISAPVYAELLAYPRATPHFVDSFCKKTGIVVDFAFGEALWRAAATSFAEYATRRRESSGGGVKRFLADFMVGAHAMLEADRLLTLDGDRYSTAFPQLRIVP
jgi:predicted nucleic acid-binding protein